MFKLSIPKALYRTPQDLITVLKREITKNPREVFEVGVMAIALTSIASYSYFNRAEIFALPNALFGRVAAPLPSTLTILRENVLGLIYAAIALSTAIVL